MRTWILSLLLIVALIATFSLTEAKPETELMQAPSSLQTGKEKIGDKKGKKHSRRKGGKHQKDSERKKEKRRSRHKKCSSDSDCKHGRKCLPGKKGKICKKEF
ncbi:unnamed protein product [Hymenolepis diminuta]|uniref:Dickkopf_N domain-containing protein n=1 Tax=Hymenolepis diminuta TaxID=6216 RepID=A0A0R3SUV2_HYMDI|nr:unnamed protein product [Hymenolepis diminuta]VUZ49752.1 unnamed protein product [Hymenolepis diminuta]